MPTPRTRAGDAASASATDVAVAGRVLPLPAGTVRRVVRAVVATERRRAAISVTFLGPTAMRRLHRAYTRRDRPTDVLAFALDGRPGEVVGDIYVCRAVARREAAARGIPERQELIRLLVHGTLHVLGYDHPTGPGRTRSAMWRRQEAYVRDLA